LARVPAKFSRIRADIFRVDDHDPLLALRNAKSFVLMIIYETNSSSLDRR
jgi:hypothetical protein